MEDRKVCLYCKHMACRVFYTKTETCTGFCLNKLSPKYRTNVIGTSTCEKFEPESNQS